MRSFSLGAFLVLLVGLVGYLISSGGSPAAVASDSPSSDLAVTPINTAPQTLNVTVHIDEDQNASDGKAAITMDFSTMQISDGNYVRFTHGERVSCNGISIALGSAATYTLRVRTNTTYACYYLWNGQSFLLTAVHARTQLLPVLQPITNSSQFVVTYNPDVSGYNCPVRVVASDGIQSVPSAGATPASEYESGTYVGPNVSSLNGQGTLTMTRTCHFLLTGRYTAFNSVDITYTSTATINVTWSPPST
jgi:hypothetical protein